jgi:hypothetical protein
VNVIEKALLVETHVVDLDLGGEVTLKRAALMGEDNNSV